MGRHGWSSGRHTRRRGPAVEIRPGSVIGRAFDIYRGQAATLLGAAVIVFAIQFLLALLLPNGLLFIAGLAAFVVSIFYQGMVVNLVRDVQDGRRDHSMGELFSAGRARWRFPLIGLAIVAGIAIAIGFVLIIIPGLILLTIWAVAAPVMVIEHPGVFTALGAVASSCAATAGRSSARSSSSRSSRSRCTSSSGSSGSRSATRCGPS